MCLAVGHSGRHDGGKEEEVALVVVLLVVVKLRFDSGNVCVCVYYCSTYYKAVRGVCVCVFITYYKAVRVFITAVRITKLCVCWKFERFVAVPH